MLPKMYEDQKEKAMDTFVSVFGGTYTRLTTGNVDYKLFSKDNKLIAYINVVVLPRSIRMAYPLPITARDALSLGDKRLCPTIIWACEDGLIYGKSKHLIGQAQWGMAVTSNPQLQEIMIYYNKQKHLKYIRYK